MTKDNREASNSCGAIFAVIVDGARAMTECRFRRLGVNRWVLRFLLLLPTATPVAAQTIAFYAVPPNMTILCANGLQYLTSTSNAIPFGITSGVLSGKVTGSFFNISNFDIGSGKEGKIDLNHYLNTGAWQGDMTTSGCGCPASVGSIPTIPGNTRILQAFQDIGLGAILIIPVLDQFSPVGGSVNIVGFIVAETVSFQGVGSNWSETLEILSAVPSAPNVTATSGCTGSVNVVYNETRTNPFADCNYLITHTWSATDACGSSAIATQLIGIRSTTNTLWFTCPGSVTLTNLDPTTCTASFSNLGTPTVNDICPPVGIEISSPPALLPGNNQVVWTAYDACGSIATCSQAVYVAVLSPSIFQINSVAAQGNDLLLTWTMPQGFTGIVQATSGDISANYSNSFGDISTPIFVPGNNLFTTNYFDLGGATNAPSRFYRIRLTLPDVVLP